MSKSLRDLFLEDEKLFLEAFQYEKFYIVVDRDRSRSGELYAELRRLRRKKDNLYMDTSEEVYILDRKDELKIGYILFGEEMKSPTKEKLMRWESIGSIFFKGAIPECDKARKKALKYFPKHKGAWK